MKGKTIFLILIFLGVATQAQQMELHLEKQGTEPIGTHTWTFDDSPKEGNFRVEFLSQDEVKTLKQADEAFKKAQLDHDSVINEIKRKHGESIQGRWGYGCGAEHTMVELRGAYALITTYPATSCMVPAGAVAPAGNITWGNGASEIKQMPKPVWVQEPIPQAIITGDPEWIGHWECPKPFKAIPYVDAASNHRTSATCVIERIP